MPLFLFFFVELVEGSHYIVGEHLGVELSCADVGMAEHFAHHLDRDAVMKRGGSEGVARHVRGNSLGDARVLCDGLEV